MTFKIAILFMCTFMAAKITIQTELSNATKQNRTYSNDPEDINGGKQESFFESSGSKALLSNIGYYEGNSEKIDDCERDEVFVEPDLTCQKLLQRGSCKLYEFVVLDPEFKTGYCASRLCPPDRIFVHGSQRCHAPQDKSLCPYGKELFYTAFGTAICDCPEGTILGSDYNGVETCLPILSENQFCSKGQVQWFRDFTSPSECLEDPCNGKNLNRGLNSYPFVLNESGKQCYQLGQIDGACKSNLIYSLHLPTLKGQCASLQKLGYEVLTEREITTFNQNYGIEIVNKKDPSASLRHDTIISLGEIVSTQERSNNIQEGNIQRKISQDENVIYVFKYLQSLGITNPQLLKADIIESSSPESIQSKLYSGSLRSHEINDQNISSFISNDNTLSKEVGDINSESKVLYRQKRQDSPTTAMPTKLVTCKPGVHRDVNGKCKETTLGPSNGSSGASIPPTPSCPSGQSFNIRRMCVSSAQSSFG